MSKDRDIADTLAKYGEPFDASTVWRVQGTPVISHKCLERIAARAQVRWERPQVIRAERDEAVIMVVGRIGDLEEWSIGEALINVNYRVSGKQAAYVWAMAEKRAKDRVILKLINLHGDAYSEEEADEFKTERPATVVKGSPFPEIDGVRGDVFDAEPARDESSDRYVRDCERSIAQATDAAKLHAWWTSEADTRRSLGLRSGEVATLKNRVMAKLDALKAKEAA